MITLNLIIIVFFLFFFGWRIRLIFRNSIYFIFVYYSLFLFFKTSSNFCNIRITFFTNVFFFLLVLCKMVSDTIFEAYFENNFDICVTQFLIPYFFFQLRIFISNFCEKFCILIYCLFLLLITNI